MKTPLSTRHNTSNGISRILPGLALAACLLTGPSRVVAANPAPVDLGSAGRFAILAGTAITASGIIYGNVGLSPTTGAAITGLSAERVHGIIYAVDAAGPAGSVAAPALLTTAKVDLAAAYTNAQGRSQGRITKTGDIGGQTLTNGLYWSASSLAITGDLTLDALGDSNAVWIFQTTDSTLITAAGGVGAPGSRVILANGAKAENVFWQVGSSATIGTYSRFKGTVLARTSITMNVGSTLEGRALAIDGAITYNGEIIRPPDPQPPRFTEIYGTNLNSVAVMVVVLDTTPYFPLTLQTCPDLLLPNWTTLTTVTPESSPWTFIDYNATESETERFYQAFITVAD